jgi:tetratricopeptide (TPR) repeat protein
VALCAAMAVTFLCAVLFARNKFLLEKTGIAWTFLALIPVLNIVPMMQFMAERFLYLPMIGFSLLYGSFVDRMERRSRGLALVLSAAVITLGGALSLTRSQVWKNEQTLYAATAADSHYQAIRPYYNFVSSLIDSAHYSQALVHARRLWMLTQGSAVVSNGRKADVARMFGIAQFNAGDQDSGVALLQDAVALDHANHANSIYLGIAFRKKERFDSALSVFERGSASFPSIPAFDYNRGLTLLLMKRLPDASLAFSKSIAIDSSFLMAYRALMNLQLDAGDTALSFQTYRRASLRWPDLRFHVMPNQPGTRQ